MAGHVQLHTRNEGKQGQTTAPKPRRSSLTERVAAAPADTSAACLLTLQTSSSVSHEGPPSDHRPLTPGYAVDTGLSALSPHSPTHLRSPSTSLLRI